MCDSKTASNKSICSAKDTDALRQQCPVNHSAKKHWQISRHAEVKRIICDEKNFSNQVSQHRSVPNGLDKPEHTPYRQFIEPLFNREHIAAFAPQCQHLAQPLALALKGKSAVNVIREVAEPFAVQVQCAFLGWPNTLQQPLLRWTHDNYAASLAGDKEAMKKIAQQLTDYVYQLLRERRANKDHTPKDITTEIMCATIHGKAISDADIVSIMRNWTMGEIGTIGASVGIMLHFLAAHPWLQQHLRQHTEDIPEAVEEMLRRHGPLLHNRRRATEDVTIGEHHLNAGDTITVSWPEANRDERVFTAPDEFRWGRDHSQNLLYGAGLHVCPGAPLARLELQTILRAILTSAGAFTLCAHKPPCEAHYPASGYRELWLDFSHST